jgi:hypothetical protein
MVKPNRARNADFQPTKWSPLIFSLTCATEKEGLSLEIQEPY